MNGERNASMHALVLYPARLTALSAIAVAEQAGVCLTARLGRGYEAVRFHRIGKVAGKNIAMSGRFIGLNRTEGNLDSWDGQENSVQAEGNDPGP
jgi:hypothetical protein